MIKKIAAVSLMVIMPALTFAADFVAGKDYKVLTTSGQVEKAGMIEVREFFWYGCPHCFRLDPFVEAWRKTKPQDVNFVRTPAALNPVWEGSARGYYAVEMLGLLEQTHVPLFNAIHEKQVPIFDEAKLAIFYQRFGVDAAKFHGLFNSFAITGKVSQAKALAQKYQLEGVPAVVVNGKYVVSGENQKVIDVTNFLIAKERGAVKKK